MKPPFMQLRADGPADATLDVPAPASTEGRREPGALARLLAKPELVALLVAAGLLYLWGLSKNGMANEYYAATVRSMASSWHNFIYGSFDMNGVMTVDKPPMAMWAQALSVKVFGFSSLAILVPQALMGVASVALTYDIVSRRFGRWPAAAAGAVLALTPMTVAISRHNNPDALLILLCVAAIWFTVRALEDGKTRWILLGGAAVGAAFTTKMGAALLVVPAIGAAYLWSAPVARGRAFMQLLWGLAVMVVVAGAWPLLMALTPAASRPWISGTTDNSIWSLISGYNGLGRLNGQTGGPGGGMGGPGGGAGGVFGGSTGMTRLLNSAMGPQVGWFLGFAVVSAVAIGLFSRLRPRDPNTGWVIAIGGSFATIALAFSYAKGIFHPYYSSQLAPFTAMLVGGGVGAFTGADRQVPRQWRSWAAAAAIVAGMVTSVWALKNASADQMDFWQVVLVAICLSAAAALVVAGDEANVRNLALAGALCALLVAPGIWSVNTIGHATSGTFPAGGSSSASGSMGGPGGGGMRAPGGNGQSAGQANRGPGGGMFGNSSNLSAAVAYAATHGGGTIGVESQSTAAGSIAADGVDVAGIGGFSGRESTVSVSWLAEAVADGRLRFFLTGDSRGGMGGDTRQGSTAAMAAVAEVCTPVTLDTTDSTNTTSTTSTSSGFYDCSGKASELAALAS